MEGSLPPAAIPHVADLYAGWCLLGEDQLTPKLVSSLHRWLTEIESAHHPVHHRKFRRPFGGALSNEHVLLLETNLRTAFLSHCHHIPSLADTYLRSLNGRRHGDTVVGEVLKFPGSLPRAVPEELAKFVIGALKPDRARQELDPSVSLRDAFGYSNHLFMLPSPELGPFRDLLCHAQPTGLNLIRQIVDHAVSFYSRDQSGTSDAITITFGDGNREFSYPQSYAWARAFLGPDTVVTTALMALGEWGHVRIENGEAVDTVLADLLGSSNPPAAYLLVAVDLLRKHWPLSRGAAVAFAACPELLCLDQNLAQSERRGGIVRDSVGRAVTLCSLYDFLPQYANSPPFEHRDRLASLLRSAAERLGPYGERSHRGHPDFMVSHALNIVDPRNWRSVDQPDGTQAMEYVVPEEEERHLAPLSKEFEDQHADELLQYHIMSALENPTKSSPDLAEAAVEWARRQAASARNLLKTHQWVVAAAAALAMRDGDHGLRSRTDAWARTVFEDALHSQRSPFGPERQSIVQPSGDRLHWMDSLAEP